MIVFRALRQYSGKTNQIKFPLNKDKPFYIVYMGENSTFIESFKKFNFRYTDIFNVIIPLTRVPTVTRLLPEERKEYRKIKWIPRTSNDTIPKGRSLVYDLSKFFTAVENKFHPLTWRFRVGNLLKNMLNRSFSGAPENYEKILMYHIDVTKPFNDLINSKIFPVLLDLRNGIIQFDHLLLCITGHNGTTYRLLIKDKNFDISRIKSYIRNVHQENFENDEINDDDISQAAAEVTTKVKDDIQPENSEKLHGLIKTFFKSDPSMMQTAIDKINFKQSDAQKIATSAIMSNINGDVKNTVSSVNKIHKDNTKKMLQATEKNLIDEILPVKKVETTTNQTNTKMFEPVKNTENKNPLHIFQKRKLDFETNLKKDTTNSFSTLEHKDFQLLVHELKIEEKEQNPAKLSKSDESTISITLKDKKGKVHSVKIDIPRIHSDGTFTVDGRKKCLVNQIILIPITFPKIYESRFESFYAPFRINSKRTKRKNYLMCFMGSYQIPLFGILAFAFGFEETCRRYGITFKLVKEKVKKDVKFSTKIDKEYSIIFENVNSEVKEELCSSFLELGISKYYPTIKAQFGTKEYFAQLITEYTGRMNSTYLIQQSIDNIVDPIAKQILINKNLPFTLENIMQYMATKVVTGIKQERNDLEIQRIRNSEVLVHLIQKKLLTAYTVYREQLLSASDDASRSKVKFTMDQREILNEFINNSQIVVDMEYANPMEEMSTLTRVSPVGKNVGGIPDPRAMQTEFRNVHDSYFGNIDPLDTPEGGNVGVVQHLSIDAFITSSRGLFQKKEKTNTENTGLLSTSSSMIPFVENDDGPRVMFGANQARQTVPLKSPEPPLVQTGYESILTNVLSDNFVKKSPCNGTVTKITLDFLELLCENKKKNHVDMTPRHLRSGSGKNTLSVFNPVVKVGQKVKEGQIIAEGSYISKGSISLGRSLLTAVMPYKGYNFEDGIVISETLAKSQKLTSLHGIEIEVIINEKDKIQFINTLGKETTKGEPLLRKLSGEIGELIGFDEEEEGIVQSGGQRIYQSPGGRIVDIEVFSNVSSSKFPMLEKLIERTNKKHGIKDEKYLGSHNIKLEGILIKFKIEQEMYIGIGDKLTNRHGAKGIVSLIEKDENMPITPWGERVEIIINPIGIISRMNIGQLYELYMGLISKSIALHIIKYGTKEKAYNLLTTIIPLLDKTKDKVLSKSFLNNFRALTQKQFEEFLNELKNNKGFSIVIPPMRSPNYKDIILVLKALDLHDSYKLKLPEFGMETYNDVPVGYMYFLKLEHIGKEKIHGRSTGPVQQKSYQPTAGKSHEGGQRMGELDTYSFISYNALTTLSECFSSLSDDIKSKNEMISEIVQNGETTFREPKDIPVKDLLNHYFTSLILERE